MYIPRLPILIITPSRIGTFPIIINRLGVQTFGTTAELSLDSTDAIGITLITPHSFGAGRTTNSAAVISDRGVGY